MLQEILIELNPDKIKFDKLFDEFKLTLPESTNLFKFCKFNYNFATYFHSTIRDYDKLV